MFIDKNNTTNLLCILLKRMSCRNKNVDDMAYSSLKNKLY